jgi:signal transduction histidine kinase
LVTEQRGELRVGAHVLVQLGSELVTDVEQALLECVKNAYDADSPGCRISIDTEAAGSLEEVARADALMQFGEPAENVSVHFLNKDGLPLKTPQPDDPVHRRLDYRGSISIEDGGVGIPFDDLARSWLVISASLKRGNSEGPKRKTPLGRTPLGDKGLGRLGTMKLGDILLVESATSTLGEIASAWFRWADCESARTIDEIPVNLARRPNPTGFKGTRVSILGLHDLDEWKRKGRLNEITRSLARLISPFEAAATFPVVVQLDGGEQSLSLVTDELLARAVADFKFEWQRIDGKPVLIAHARIRRRLLASKRTRALRDRTARVFEQDGGAEFAAYLEKSRRLVGFDRTTSDPEGPWFAVIERRFEGADLLWQFERNLENPGPFSGAFYFFHFVGDEDDQAGAASGTGADLNLVRDLAGISILRDGFQVRNRGDWLSLSAGMTSGSTYSMRPENTLGYFALTGEQNFKLVEKSDREGFVDNAAYRGFFAIARACRDFANTALISVRRTLDEYYNELKEKGASEESPSAEGDLARVGSMAAAAHEVSLLASKLGEEVELLGSAQGGSSDRVQRVLAIAQEVLQAASGSLNLGETPSALISRIERELIEGKERSIALVESAAAGLAARGLTHELRTHLAEIRHRVTTMERSGGLGGSTTVHLTAIRRSCAAIAQAAAQVDPMVSRAKEIKDTFDVLSFAKSYFDQRTSILGTSSVSVEVTGEPLFVRMSQSRLLQTLDNLTRNSVFWLSRVSKSKGRKIQIRTTESGLIFSDSGPGIDPFVEETLFDLFVTTREQDEGGQGLGLFITSELLALDGCGIALLSDRNKGGRRYRFKIDLTAVRRET